MNTMNHLDIKNLRLCTTHSGKNVLIFAYDLDDKKIIGSNIIQYKSLPDIHVSLEKFNDHELKEVSKEKVNRLLDESDPDFNENIMFTYGYFTSIGIPFKDNWAKLSFTKKK